MDGAKGEQMSVSPSRSFDNFWNDDRNFTPTQRASITFYVELLGILIEAREAGHTYKSLAKATGLKKKTIKRIWSLDSALKLETLAKLLTPLGYKLDIVPISGES